MGLVTSGWRSRWIDNRRKGWGIMRWGTVGTWDRKDLFADTGEKKGRKGGKS